MLTAILVLCGLGALVCVVGVVMHLRVLRRLEHLAAEVERRVAPYLRRQAAAVRYETPPPAPLRTPEQIIEDAAQLAEALTDIARRDEDLALGPTQQNLSLDGTTKKRRA